jgi:hypothetical protein
MSSRLRFAALLPLALLVIVLSPASRASCGSASCFLVTQTKDGIAGAGVFQFDLSFRYVDQDRKLSGTGTIDEVLTPKIDFEAKTIVPDHHREISTRSSTLQAEVAYGVTERVTVLADLPLFKDKDHQHWDDVGSPGESFVANAGHRGLGDIAVGARYAFLVRPYDLVFGTALVKAPTGPYKELDSEGAIDEPGIQPGTGSWDGALSATWAHDRRDGRVEGFLTGSWRENGRNGLDYRLGRELQLSGGARFPIGSRGDLSVQLNGERTERDDYLGTAVPSTGHTILYLTPAGRIASKDGLAFYGYVQVPLFERVNDAQLAPRVGLVAGVSKTF